jgi:Protein of unknown function, DUF547
MRLALVVSLVAATSSACFGGTIKPDAAAGAAAPVPFPYAEWSALLAKYVDGKGRVDYNAIDKAAFDKVFAAVAASSPKKTPDKYPSPSAQKAYYIDAYNVLVWKNVLTRLPKLKNVDSEKVSFFYFTKFLVGGDDINLYDLENKIIRPQFKDARVHFALNCASGGCPQLPRDAFTPEKVDEQLSREARKFCNEKRNVDFDPATKKVKLSHIFDWYKDDFGKEPAKVIAWINNYRAADAKLPTDAKIEYVDYDWTLNDVHLLNR